MACRITDFSETFSTADVLEGLSEVFQKAKSVPDEVQKLLTTLNMIPEFKNQKSIQDKEVETVVYCFKLVVEGIFSLAQSYVTKCHKLADYICEEEPHTIKVINEGNVKEFKEFLDEVLSYSDSCQKELKALLQFMEAEKKQLIDKKQSVQNKESKAKNKARLAGGVGIGGGITLGGVLASAGTMTLITFASSIGPQAPITIPFGLAVTLGASLLAAAGGTAITGTAVGGVLVSRYVTEMDFYKKILEAFKETHDNLTVIQVSLENINEQLKLGIDNNLLGMQGEQKMNKLKSGSEFVKSSILKSLRTLIKQTETLEEYCRPLMDASDSEEFFILKEYQFVEC